MRRLTILLLLCAGMLAGTQTALAEKRLALVIGNSNYKHAPRLRNPANDATDIAAALRRLGFEVVEGRDLDFAGMRRKVREFSDKLAGADVGLFFYAGHGIQVSGKNYLMPVDVNLQSETDLDFTTVDADLVLRNMEREPRTNIVFLDACRDNPLAANLARRMGTRSASVGRGLAAVQSGVGTLIAFATQPGNVALDGRGRNSPFTAALLRNIARPGLSLSEVMIAVRNDVLKQTANKQVPWDHSSLTGQFFFVPKKVAAVTSGAPTATAKKPAPVPSAASLEITFWDSIKDSKNPRLFEAYLRRYPKGTFSEIAKISLEELGKEAKKTAVALPADKILIRDRTLLHEIRDRLYELNFDPGPVDGPLGERTRRAIREFEAQSKIAMTGEPTQGLLRRLRAIGGLKPWGAIVYARDSQKWGMSWSQSSRRAAVDSARKSCGDAKQCSTEISFFGTECGAFVHSGDAWAIVARDDVADARKEALADCGKRSDSCRVIASVCADGADRATAN